MAGGLFGVLDSLLGVEHRQAGDLLGSSQCAAIIALVELKLHLANQIRAVIERNRQMMLGSLIEKQERRYQYRRTDWPPGYARVE